MKGYLLFVLLFIFNCDMSTRVKVDYDKISLLLLNVNSSTITNNNSSGYKPGTNNGGTYLSSCGLECLETISGKYFFNDYYPDPNYCNNNWSSGNNNGIPEPGENGVLQIPLIYYGNNPLPKLEAELIPDNPNIKIFSSKLVWYPALPNPTGRDNYYSCINTYYEEWGIYHPHSVCNTDYRHECMGWKVQIPNNFFGYVDFKIMITSSIGSKVLKYRL